MYTYIKKAVIGNYIESDVPIESIDGYQNSVGITWKDFENNLFVLLSEEQIRFRNDNPNASVEEVFSMYIPEPPEPPEPEEPTVDDAKADKHTDLDAYADSLRFFNVNDSSVWFDDRADMKIQIDAEIAYGEKYVTFYNGSKAYRLTTDDANNTILAIEHYNTQLNDRIQAMHNQIDAATHIEDVEHIDITAGDYPKPLEFYVPEPEPPTPTEDDYPVYMKLGDHCYTVNVDSRAAKGSKYGNTIYPEKGYALLRGDVCFEMNAVPQQIIFVDDLWGRPDYASEATVFIDDVQGDIFIAAQAIEYTEGGSSVEPTPASIYHEIIYDVMPGCWFSNGINAVDHGMPFYTDINADETHLIEKFSACCYHGKDGIELSFDDAPEDPAYAVSVHIDIPSVTEPVQIICNTVERK